MKKTAYNTKMLSVMDVCWESNITPIKEITRQAGNIARNLYKEKYKKLPIKELRPKVAQSGSHCIAVYPKSFRKALQSAIYQAACNHLTGNN